MHYIKDIFENKITDHAHNKFVRYSKGEFVGPLITMRFSKNDIKVSGSFHFADEFLYILAEVLGNKKVHIKGSLVWNKDLSSDLESLGIKYLKVTKLRGIFKYTLDNEVELKNFMNVLGTYNILASIKDGDISIVTKSSFPKPNKEFGDDFCKISIPSSYEGLLLKEFAFDVKGKGFKKIEIKHKIIVDDIKIPNIDNFEEARRLAKRVGKLKRMVSVNGEEPKVTEININV